MLLSFGLYLNTSGIGFLTRDIINLEKSGKETMTRKI